MATMDGYVRVSRRGERDEEESTEVYRAQIGAWATGHDVVIGELVEDTDVSGSVAVADRGLERLVRRVEEGASSGIVTPHIDRFGRDLIEGALALKRIHEAGGRLVAPRDGFDSTSPGSALIFNFRMAVAQDYLDRVKANWSAATSRAVADGIHIACRAPVGYLRADQVNPQHDARGKLIRDGRLLVDPETVPAILRAYEMRDKGKSYREIDDYLYDTLGRRFATSTISAVLKNRAYVGEARGPGGATKADAHEAIVPVELFERVQSRAGTYHPRNGSLASQVLLAGIVTCESCGHKLRTLGSTNPQTGERKPSYVCAQRYAGGDCGAPASARADRVDEFVTALLMENEDEVTASVASAAEQYLLARDAVREAGTALDSWVDDPTIATSIGRERFQRGMLARQAALDEARRVLWGLDDAGIADDSEVVYVGGKPYVYEVWGKDAEADRRHIRRYVAGVTVAKADPKRRRWQPIEERVSVQWVGAKTSAGAELVAA
jgi:DNA invertase Pin-like site-specific DNA recombinase